MMAERLNFNYTVKNFFYLFRSANEFDKIQTISFKISVRTSAESGKWKVHRFKLQQNGYIQY